LDQFFVNQYESCEVKYLAWVTDKLLLSKSWDWTIFFNNSLYITSIWSLLSNLVTVGLLLSIVIGQVYLDFPKTINCLFVTILIQHSHKKLKSNCVEQWRGNVFWTGEGAENIKYKFRFAKKWPIIYFIN